MSVVDIATYRLPQVVKIRSGLGLVIVVTPAGISGANFALVVHRLRDVVNRHDDAFRQTLTAAPYTRRAPALGQVLLPGRHYPVDVEQVRQTKMRSDIGVRLCLRWVFGMDVEAITAFATDAKRVLQTAQRAGGVHVA